LKRFLVAQNFSLDCNVQYARSEHDDNENAAAREDNVPSGYEVIPLISAINGPVTSASFTTSLASEGTYDVTTT